MGQRRRSRRLAVVAALASLWLVLPGANVTTARLTSPAGRPIEPLSDCAPVDCWRLTVSLSGNGSGTWKSAFTDNGPDNGIDCELLNGVVTPGSTCSELYFDSYGLGLTNVYFAVTAATGSSFCWGQTCGLTLYNGQLTISTDTTTDAAFTLDLESLHVTLTGSGTVYSSPGSISCGKPVLPLCIDDFYLGTSVTLTATPSDGLVLLGWSGACAPFTSPTCTLTMTSNLTVGASFGVAPTPGPTVPQTPRPTSTTSSPVPSTTGSVGSPASPAASGSSPTSPSSSAGGPPGGPSSSPSPLPGVESGQQDLGPLVLAILGAGLLVALAVFAGLALQRRKSPGPI